MSSLLAPFLDSDIRRKDGDCSPFHAWERVRARAVVLCNPSNNR